MFIVHVFVQVKAGFGEQFIAASLENAKASLQEPGIARFDILQDQDDPDRFVLVEVYLTKLDTARHKETAHYQRWKTAVADMMAIPRSKKVYENIFPDDEGWVMP